jgi:hypothetical protein
VRLEFKTYDGPQSKHDGATQVEIALSRRNLRALLAKLDQPGSARRPESIDAYVHGERAIDVVLVVRGESDEEHYNHPLRTAPTAGPVHSKTERLLPNAGDR